MTILFAVLFGLAIGSFLNVCIWRIPRQENLVRPSSHCPLCQRDIRWYDNIPLLSYLALGGKCRSCGARISYRYPLVEAITGLGFGLLVDRFGIGLPTLFYLVFFSTLVVLTFIDLEHMILPFAITVGGIFVGLLASFLPGFIAPVGLPLPPVFRLLPAGFVSSVVGLLLGGGLFWSIGVLGEVLFKKEAMGGGDIPMVAMIGSFLGWQKLFLSIFLASLSGSVVGVVLVALRLKGRKGEAMDTTVPFGPFLALGATLSLLWGGSLIEWYGRLLR
jgi:leader peptidase (prepilin peptidase) / N-methyltransferase